MFREAARALMACVLTFLVCAVAYPSLVWGLAQLAFPHQAAGSPIFRRDRSVLGSERVAQPFRSDRYFHPRPSAVDYAADATGGSNQGPNHPKLRAAVEARVAALGATPDRPAPADLVLASGSGIDPEISPEAARYQAPRVAAARGLPPGQVLDLVEARVDRSGAILGAPPRVNVLLLNLALDVLSASK